VKTPTLDCAYVASKSIAEVNDVRVGDIIKSVESVTTFSKLAALKRSINRIVSFDTSAKKLRLNFMQNMEVFYKFLSKNDKVILSLRRLSASSPAALRMALDIRSASGGGPASTSSGDDDSVETLHAKHESPLHPTAEGAKHESPSHLIEEGVNEFLSYEEHHKLLTYAENHREVLSSTVVVNPRAGAIVLYDYSSQEIEGMQHDEKKMRFHLRCDQYRFAHNTGEKAVGKVVRLRRAFYNLLDESNLTGSGRHEFRRLEVRKDKSDQKIILFHYVGDSDLAVQVSNNAPHGNSKHNVNTYIRTKPFVKMNIVNKMTSGMTPHQLYVEMQGEKRARPTHSNRYATKY
jgi:hypothetical protein